MTRLDLEIEPKLCECTLLRYPDHGVLGEEFGARRTGFIGAFGVLGAALSGYLLAKVIDVWGWNGFFLALSIPPLLSAPCCCPFWGSASTWPSAWPGLTRLAYLGRAEQLGQQRHAGTMLQRIEEAEVQPHRVAGVLPRGVEHL